MTTASTSLRYSRRQALTTAAAVAAGGLLAACSSAKGGAATPTAGSAKVVLIFQPWQTAYGFQNLGKAVNTLMYEATAPFREQNPSIELQMYGPDTNPVAATIAGSGPDVPQLQGGGGGIDGWLGANLLLNLRPYIQQSNLDLTVFSKGQLDTVTTSAGVFGLPNYMGTAAIVVNQTVLDDLGLDYPSTTWDYQEFAQFVSQVSGPLSGGAWRYGTTLDWSEYGPDAFYFRGFGGSIVDPANPAHCTLDSDACIQAGEYLYQMLWNKSATTGRVDTNAFAKGSQVAPFAWVQQMLSWVTSWRDFKWDFYPMPTWPKGDFSMTNPNYFAINAATKNPDAAWTLLHWLCAEPDWQRSMMKIVLLPPGYLPIWDEWLATVRAVAPPLAPKNLEVFSTLVHTGNAIQVNGARFAYGDAQAKPLLQSYTDQLTAQKATVRTAFTQAAAQINAFEAQEAKVVSGGVNYGAKAKAILAGLPAQLQALPGLFPSGGKTP